MINLDKLIFYEKIIQDNGDHKYIYKCRNENCNNKIIVRQSNRHNGDCKQCSNALKRKRPYETLYNIFIKNNKENNYLTYEDFNDICSVNACHYCGAATIRSKYKNKSWRNSYMIDRKNNNIGYTVDNCVSCCWPCNDLKSDRFTYEQFIKLSAFIKTL